MITNEEYFELFRENGILWDGIPERIRHIIDSSPFSLYNFIKPLESEFQLCANYSERYRFWDRHGVSWYNEIFTALANYTINKQKESEMEEKEFVLTEDVSLYQLRDMPNAEILEIVIPKTEEGRNCSQYPCRVVYRNKEGRVAYHLTTLDGYSNASKCKAKMDVILKPKKRPFTHEEILELIGTGTLFRNEKYSNCSIYLLLGYDSNTYKYRLTSQGYTYKAIIEDFEVSYDKGKTWHKLEKEV